LQTFVEGALALSDFVIGHDCKRGFADLEGQNLTLPKRAVVLLGPILSVVDLLLHAVLGTPAVFDVQRHALLSMNSGGYRIVGAAVILSLLRLEHRKILPTILCVVGSFLRDELGLGFVVAPREAAACPSAEQAARTLA
jgi:hypothetical protein